MGTQTIMAGAGAGAPHRVDRPVMVVVTMLLLQGKLLHDFGFIIIDISLVETVGKATSM